MAPEADVSPNDEDDSQVILSVTAFGENPIPALEAFEVPQADGGFRYDVGHVVFKESDWSARADVLNDALTEHVARLTSATAALHRPDVWVRFFLTLPRGAETITAETLRGLASVNATLWIDA